MTSPTILGLSPPVAIVVLTLLILALVALGIFACSSRIERALHFCSEERHPLWLIVYVFLVLGGYAFFIPLYFPSLSLVHRVASAFAVALPLAVLYHTRTSDPVSEVRLLCCV